MTAATPQIAPDAGAPAASTSLVGSRIGPYQVLERLGVGGVGEVFKATDLNLNRDVAIKVLRRELAADPMFLERFRREAQLHAKLCHPNVAAVHAFLHEGATQFLVMEYVPGVTLDELIRSGGRLPATRALGIFRRTLEAIAHAHGCGIVHRDIKPANIMLTDTGQVKVMDFGIARALDGQDQLTRHGHVAGTARAMAPEQIRGKPADVRSDIYSLGIVLYTLLAGHPPFDGENDFALMKAQLEQAPPPLDGVVPDLPPGVQDVVTRALQKDPAARYGSVAEFARVLDVCIAQLGFTLPPAAAPAASPDVDAGPEEDTASRTVINPVMQGARQMPRGGAGDGARRARPAAATRPLWQRPATHLAAAAALVMGAGAFWGLPRVTPDDAVLALAAAQPAPAPVEPVPAASSAHVPPPAPPAPIEPSTRVALPSPPLPASDRPERDDARLDEATRVETPAIAMSPPREAASPTPSTPTPVRTLQIAHVTAAGADPGASQRLRPGERIALRVASSHDAHLYCYLQDEARRIVRFFPNRFRPSAQVRAAEPLDLPGAMRFELVANRRRLGETVVCFASPTDLEAALPAAAFGGDFAALPLASLDQLADAFARAAGSDTLVEARWLLAFR